jgi:hypothetical protein
MGCSLLKICSYVFASAPVLFVVGMATVILGSMRQQPAITRLGTGLFLSGVAVFLFAVGSRSLSVTILAAQTCGSKVIKERPLYSVLWIVFSLVLMLLGIGLQCMIVRGYFLPR